MAAVFDIKPYVGAGDLRLGMTPERVSELAGAPVRSMRNRAGGIEEYREGVKVVYSQSSRAATDFVLFLPAAAIYKDKDLLACQDPLDVLLKDDPAPLQGMGIIVFLKLGITVTGIGDTDCSDKTITVFAKGRWDAFRGRLTPWQAVTCLQSGGPHDSDDST